MRISTIVRSTSAVVGIAAAFALAGCGSLPGQSSGEDASDARVEETTASETPATEAATSPTESAGAEEAAEPTETGEPEGASTAAGESGSDTDDLWADKARTRSWASDDSIEVDKNGNGTIPAESLEADLVDLFTNKFGLEIKETKCDDDMKVENWQGFIVSCDVIAKDTTYFGTVELVDHKDTMIQYEVLFPGIDEKDLDLKG
ncbi:hypothetical protein [Brevibacterium sp.]|uniref:hypothetical protein n=1 Tax=Brevibacterium sp. TaxID=1701 RepID=UPI00281193C0|nr:hypothetical protein [Brevibacterium sp.]